MKNFASKITIKSDFDKIKNVMSWIQSDLKHLFKAEDKYTSLKLGLQEAITNAIVHGNKSDKNKSVTISYSIKEKLSITVKDEGEGIHLHNQLNDINKIKEEDIFKESGRGIILMKHFCDEIIFNKNSITLIMPYK